RGGEGGLGERLPHRRQPRRLLPQPGTSRRVSRHRIGVVAPNQPWPARQPRTLRVAEGSTSPREAPELETSRIRGYQTVTVSGTPLPALAAFSRGSPHLGKSAGCSASVSRKAPG